MKALAPEHLRLLQAACDARETLRLGLTGRSDARDAMGRAAALLTSGIKARMSRGDSRVAIPNLTEKTASPSNTKFTVPGAFDPCRQ